MKAKTLEIIMEKQNGLDWVKLVRIDSKWIDTFLLTHGTSSKRKVRTRAYSLRFDGTRENMLGLVEFMVDRVKQFVFSDFEIKEFEKGGQEPWRKAAQYLGNRDPSKEGKYGELLLFLLVEAVLNTPMIAHKIRSLSDYNDQVKGSDGVFFGLYRNRISLLFGESKMYQDRSQAMREAFQSISKFYDKPGWDKEIKSELFVARQNLSKDLSPRQIESLLKVLDIQSKEYQTTNKVHPILIVYDEEEIPEIEKKCTCKDDGERLVHDTLSGLAKDMMPTILEKLNSDSKSLEKIYLDFFFLPVSSVCAFRELLYNSIHNLPSEKVDK